MPEPNNTGEKIQFTEAQQAKIDSIVKERMAAAGREAREEAERARAELRALKLQLGVTVPVEIPGADGDGTPPAVSASPVPDTSELESLRSELSTLKKQRETDVVRNALITASQKEGAIDPEVMAMLLSKSVAVDEHGNLQVVSEAGTPRLGADFTPLSVESLVKEFAESRPFLIRGQVKPGTGSSESMGSYRPQVRLDSIFGAKSDARKAMALKREDPERYRQLREAAKAQGLLR